MTLATYIKRRFGWNVIIDPYPGRRSDALGMVEDDVPAQACRDSTGRPFLALREDNWRHTNLALHEIADYWHDFKHTEEMWRSHSYMMNDVIKYLASELDRAPFVC